MVPAIATPSPFNTSTLQRAFRQYADVSHWSRPFAVTLTMRQRLHTYEAGCRSSVSLSPELASDNLRHFLALLNRHIFGNAARRYGKQVKVIAVLEGDQTKRYHYHLALDCPRPDLAGTFPALVASLWAKTDWGYGHTHITPADQGWVGYMSKWRDKADFGSAIDWMNYHNPA